MIDEAIQHIEQVIAVLEKTDKVVYWVLHFEHDVEALKLIAQARRERKPDATVQA